MALHRHGQADGRDEPPTPARPLPGVPGGGEVLAGTGAPGEVTVDLTGLWHRETELVGAYTYGTERLAQRREIKSFFIQEVDHDKIVLYGEP